MKIFDFLFGWTVKTFQYFFPPHKAIQARYVALFALACMGWGAFGMTFGYLYYRVWHNPNIPFGLYANQPPRPSETFNSYPPSRVADADNNAPKKALKAHKTGTLAHVHVPYSVIPVPASAKVNP